MPRDSKESYDSQDTDQVALCRMFSAVGRSERLQDCTLQYRSPVHRHLRDFEGRCWNERQCVRSGYGSRSTPGGYLLNRYDNRKIITVAVLIYVLVGLAIQIPDTFTAFFVLRVLGGIVGGLIFISGQTL